MTIFDRYLARAILAATGVVALVVAALVVLMLFIGETGHIGERHYGLFQALAYTALMVPARLSLVLPVVALLGSLLALGGLASGRELVVIRGAGVSMQRLAVSVGLAGLALAVVAVALGEVLAPAGQRGAETLRHRARFGHSQATVKHGLWLRQGHRVLRIHATLPGGRMVGLDVYRLSADGRLREALRADTARVTRHGLVIDHPKFTRLWVDHSATGAPAELTLKLRIDPRLLALAVTQPSELSSAALWRYIDYLQRNGIDAADYRLALWRNIVTPFEVWMLVVFALAFALGSLRGAGAGQRLVAGAAAGLVFFLINDIVAATGPVYGVPPWLAAAAPTLALGAGTAWWLRRLG